MKRSIAQKRLRAVERFCAGEKAESICASLGQSPSWLYKCTVKGDVDQNHQNRGLGSGRVGDFA